MNRLLVIEDEEVILKALTRLLERNHYEVTPARSVEEALEFEPRGYDLILGMLCVQVLSTTLQSRLTTMNY